MPILKINPKRNGYFNCSKAIGLLSFLLICLPISAQTPDLQWYDVEGGSGHEQVLSLVAGDNGSTYLAGYYDGDLFIRKYDVVGKMEWNHRFTGGGLDAGLSIVIDKEDNIYVTGYFQNALDFDPGIGSQVRTAIDKSDCYLLSLDKNGKYRWVITYGTTGDEWGNAVHTDQKGHVYLTGYFENQIDFDPGPGTHNLTSNGRIDAFVLQLDTTGAYQWATSFGGSSYDRGQTITTTPDGSVYVGGSFWETVDFDPGPSMDQRTSAGRDDAFLVKLDSKGSFLWSYSFGNTQNDRILRVEADEKGDVYMIANARYTIDVDPGVSTRNINLPIGGMAVIKLSASGSLVWGKGIDQVIANSMDMDSAANLYLVGQYGWANDFNPDAGIDSLHPGNGMEVFISSWDTAGNYRYSFDFEGNDDETVHGIYVDHHQNLLLGGSFEGTMDADPGNSIKKESSRGRTDLFVGRFNQCAVSLDTLQTTVCDSFISPGGKIVRDNSVFTELLNNSQGCDSILRIELTVNQKSSSSFTEKACRGYKAPSGKTTWTQSGIYWDTIPNAGGCDSSIRIDLTVVQIDPTVKHNFDQNGLVAVDGFESYQWVDCDADYAFVDGATMVDFKPAKKGSYAVIITHNGCSDTSLCLSIEKLSFTRYPIEKIYISPNPAQDQIYVHRPDKKTPLDFLLWDNQGRLVLEKTLEYSDEFVDIKAVQSGIYFVELKRNGSLNRTPLIIHKR